MESNRHNLSKENLSALLYAWTYETSRQPALRDLQERLAAVSPQAQQSEDPRSGVFTEKFTRQGCDLMAERLLADDRNCPLFTKEEAVAIASERGLLKEYFGVELTDGDETCINDCISSMIGVLFERLQIVSQDQDSYEVWWRRINALLDISEERKMSSLECLASSEANDELMRRIYSKTEYITKMMIIHKIVNPETLRALTIEPLLKMLASQYEYDEEELEEMKKDAENELMPQLRALCEAQSQVRDDWIKERVAQIYGA